MSQSQNQAANEPAANSRLNRLYDNLAAARRDAMRTSKPERRQGISELRESRKNIEPTTATRLVRIGSARQLSPRRVESAMMRMDKTRLKTV